MPTGGGYVRVYQSILNDPKFESIYDDDHHLATWLRMLMVADQMWPVHPPIPRIIREHSFRALVNAGLIDLMPRGCYRIHGLDAERNARRNASRIAAASRWHSNGIAEGNAISMPLPRPSPRPSPSPSPTSSQSDFDRRVESTQRELKKLRGEA